MSENTSLHLNNFIPPKTWHVHEGKIHLIEIASQTGNLAILVLTHEKNPILLGKLIDSLQPVITQASRVFQSADVATAISYIDDLTGLYNHRFLVPTLRNEVARAHRYGHAVSLLFIDLDKFKQINDTHGHIVGSQVLKEAAKIFKKSVRESDFLLRYGGDEFVSILPNTPLSGALQVAERMRLLFEQTYFDVREVTKVPSAYNLNVTTSIGVASLPECAIDLNELIQLADTAMYQAKNSGKNKVCAAALRNKEG